MLITQPTRVPGKIQDRLCRLVLPQTPEPTISAIRVIVLNFQGEKSCRNFPPLQPS